MGVKPNLGVRLTIPILEQVMARLINSVDEILWCYHSNETFPAEFLHNAKYFLGLFRQKVYFLHFVWPLFLVKGLRRLLIKRIAASVKK